jgi:hypothetical protein
MKLVNVIAVCAGLLGLSLSTGCTFCCLDGNGPLERSSVAADLPVAGADDLAKLKGEVDSLPVTLTPPVGKGFPGYAARSGHSYNWDVLCGGGTVRTLLKPGDAGKRTLLMTADRWGISRPLYWTLDCKTMDAETGECLSSEKATMLTMLFVHASARTPWEPDKNAQPEYLSKQKSLDEVKYAKMSGMCIGAGLLAWGQKNNRAYFQLAWIPIPLWSLE